MPNSYRDLHNDSWKEWRDEQADEFTELQRRAFKAGFEAAAAEAKEFRQLRNWVEEERDETMEKYEERDDDDMMFARQMAYKEILVKLSKMGCHPE
jgi:hypothetical protein